MTDLVLPDTAPVSLEAPKVEAPKAPGGMNTRVVIVAAALLGGGAAWLASAFDWRHGALLALGGALGLALYHAAFGFTSAYRVLLTDRRGAGVRAQMLMMALAVILFFPVLANGSLFGAPVRPNLAPLGLGVAVGAFVFGIGMQLGGGCASGTLFSVGGGSTRMVLTLAFFIVGSVLGVAHMPWWEARPALAPISAIHVAGWPTALAVHLALFAAIAALTVWVERKAHGAIAPGKPSELRGAARFVRGPWPLAWGAGALAIGNFATLAIAGKPWGITSAFALWGSKLAQLGGVDVASWTYWSAPGPAKALHASVFADTTSVMDFGIILGALLAAGLAGKFAPTWTLSRPSAAAAIVGGLLLGYGGRIAHGCNIGAYFSGIASGSLHGWLWIAAAFAGNAVGTRIRPWFGLAAK